MKKFSYLLIGLFLIFITSCKKEPIERSVNDLSESKIVDLIRLNFLEQYGGLQFERIETSAELKDTIFVCNLLHFVKLSEKDNFFNWNGDLSIDHQCDYNSPFNVIQRQIKIDVKNVTFNINELGWIINGDKVGNNKSIIQYVMNTDKSKMVYYQEMLRNNMDLSNKLDGIDALGSIQVISNLCLSDHPSIKISKDVKYQVNLNLSDKSIDLKGLNTLKGEIILNAQNEWNFTSDASKKVYKM
jgi:hypothetical protein